jgi:hypothetical protein
MMGKASSASNPTNASHELWRRHVTEALGPPSGRASVPARVMWLQTRLLVREGFGTATCPVALSPRAYPCVLKMPDIRLIMASLGTRASNALNAYVTGHTQRMAGIQCVQDVDAVGR